MAKGLEKPQKKAELLFVSKVLLLLLRLASLLRPAPVESPRAGMQQG